MSNLGALLKVDLRENLDFRKFKENKSKTTGFLIVITLAILGGLALATIYAYLFGSMMNEAGINLSYLLTLMLGFSSFLCFSTVLFKSKSIFTGKDYEILSAMPIKQRDIIASKIFGLYIVELVYSAIIMLPTGVVATILSLNPIFILDGFIGALLVPAVPIAVGSLFSLFIAFVADRFKFGNAISLFLYFVLIVGIFFLSYFMSSNTSGGTVDANATINLVNVVAWINPVNQIYLLSYTNNYLFILVFVGANLLILTAAILFIALSYKPIYEAINNLTAGYKYERKDLKVEGQGKTLLKNEFKRYFKSKMYIMNTLCGGIMAIITPAVMYFSIAGQLIESGYESLLSNYAYFAAVMIVLMVGIETPATCGISIEGPNFWLIKSLPVNYKTYCKNKIFMSTIVLSACSLIGAVVFGIIAKANLLSWIVLIVLPIVYIFMASSMGLYINLHFYKLKWKNEQECVKNGAGIVVSMIIDMVLSLVLGFLLIGLPFIIGPYGDIIGIAIAGGITVVLAIVFFALVVTKCEEKIKQIEEF